MASQLSKTILQFGHSPGAISIVLRSEMVSSKPLIRQSLNFLQVGRHLQRRSEGLALRPINQHHSFSGKRIPEHRVTLTVSNLAYPQNQRSTYPCKQLEQPLSLYDNSFLPHILSLLSPIWLRNSFPFCNANITELNTLSSLEEINQTRQFPR